MKAPTLIRSIEADLAAGHVAVVQIVSTGEAARTTAGHHSAKRHFFLVIAPDGKHLFFVTPGRGRWKVRFRPAFLRDKP